MPIGRRGGRVVQRRLTETIFGCIAINTVILEDSDHLGLLSSQVAFRDEIARGIR